MLAAYAAKQQLILSEVNPSLRDLDTVSEWLSAPNKYVDCEIFLHVWNLFDDVETSLSGISPALTDSGNLNIVYQKLFYGNNLPAVTPEGECFIPKWRKSQIKLMAARLEKGLRQFCDHLIRR